MEPMILPDGSAWFPDKIFLLSGCWGTALKVVGVEKSPVKAISVYLELNHILVVFTVIRKLMLVYIIGTLSDFSTPQNALHGYPQKNRLSKISRLGDVAFNTQYG
jgi:hypothetical protein